jgi:hypothetical protein
VNKRGWTLMAAILVAFGPMSLAKDKPDTKATNQVVDSGSFGIYVNGRRMATETFSIKQTADGSVASSQFKTDDGRAAQSAELSLSIAGEIKRYEWKETSPEKGTTVVEPQNEFLVERITGGEKTMEQPFLMPHTTVVLDDYFFSHREILIWKYLATSCKAEQGKPGCQISKAQFGVVVPRQRTSSMVTLEYAGRETVKVKGIDRELNRINLSSDMGDWAIWLDDQHKIIRMVIASDNSEVLRD